MGYFLREARPRIYARCAPRRREKPRTAAWTFRSFVTQLCPPPPRGERDERSDGCFVGALLRRQWVTDGNGTPRWTANGSRTRRGRRVPGGAIWGAWRVSVSEVRKFSKLGRPLQNGESRRVALSARASRALVSCVVLGGCLCVQGVYTRWPPPHPPTPIL